MARLQLEPTSYAGIIRRARMARGLSQEELASQIGVSRNTVAAWETSHSRPDLDTIPELCRVLKISLASFFGIKRNSRSVQEQAILDLFFSLEEPDREVIQWEMESIKERREKKFRDETLSSYVTCFSSTLGVAAGFGATLQDEAGEEVILLKDKLTSRADEVVTVTGRSMEPTFFDGDKVLVERCDSLKPGEIGIFLVEDTGFIKEYQSDGLYSHNPDYPVMTFHEHTSVLCVGRVLGVLNDSQLPSEKQLQIIEESRQNHSGKKVRI